MSSYCRFKLKWNPESGLQNVTIDSMFNPQIKDGAVHFDDNLFPGNEWTQIESHLNVFQNIADVYNLSFELQYASEEAGIFGGYCYHNGKTSHYETVNCSYISILNGN